MTSDNLEGQKYLYHIDPYFPESIQNEHFISETVRLGFNSTVAFCPVGDSPVGDVL